MAISTLLILDKKRKQNVLFQSIGIIISEMNMNSHDVIIIGGGPGGLSAGIYAARSDLDTLVLERGILGGQIANTDLVENYPGFPKVMTGPDLTALFEEQATRFGVKIDYAEVSELTKEGNEFKLKILDEDEPLTAKAVIIGTGADPNKLNCPGEKEFAGKGVSYCAVCDANFFRNMDVAVAGGGDAAIEEGLYLTKFVRKLYIIHRRNELRAQKIIQNRAFENPKVELVWDTVVTRVFGDQVMQGLELKNVKTGNITELKCQGIFVYIGSKPNTGFITLDIEKDPLGHIVTDEYMQTKVPGLFAIGDVRKCPLRQIVTAASDGAIAAHYAEKHIESLKS
jgi:thioredoxin reductase (NADPH)